MQAFYLALLTAAIVGLGWLILNVNVAGTTAPRALDSMPPPNSEHASFAEFQLQPLDEYRVTLKRPLFHKSRRPFTDNDPGTEIFVTAESPAEVGPYVLTAVIIVGEKREVLLADPEDGQTYRRREGDSIGDWTLEEIHPEGVILSHNGETKNVRLRSFHSKASTEE